MPVTHSTAIVIGPSGRIRLRSVRTSGISTGALSTVPILTTGCKRSVNWEARRPRGDGRRNRTCEFNDKEGHVATDPVCGMRVDEHAAAAKTEYEGEMFYFCSAHCHSVFDRTPRRVSASQASSE